MPQLILELPQPILEVLRPILEVPQPSTAAISGSAAADPGSAAVTTRSGTRFVPRRLEHIRVLYTHEKHSFRFLEYFSFLASAACS